MKEVGERLKSLREGAGLSQVKIGSFNGINQSNLVVDHAIWPQIDQ